MGGPLGTLIVVVLKARNLPNKQRIGKQDPYATCTYLSHRKRTKTDKRGGQHPVWDEELRFEVYENAKDVMPSASVSTTSTGGVAPVKSRDPLLGASGNPGVRELRVAVYADDPRDPDLIGEGKVDLSDTLKKGEFDDWVTINNKGKYQGEVYLEMTFYSAKPPPETLRPLNTPTRAGVFEAGSPSSGGPSLGASRPASQNLSKSSSPLVTPSKKADHRVFPMPPRGGTQSLGFLRPSTGNLPLPGERRDSPGDRASNNRQRSTGSFSTPDRGLNELGTMPLPEPSRHQSFDLPHGLAHSMSSMSLSQKPHQEQIGTSNQGTPSSELGVPQAANQPRPHRHSFSGHSHPPEAGPMHHSISDHNSNQVIPGSVDTGFPQATHASANNQYHGDYSTPPQVIPQLLSNPISHRRPLPIPGGPELTNRPTSAWGEYQHPGSVNPSLNEVGSQVQQTTATPFSQFPVDSDRPASRMSALPNPASYLPPNPHHDPGIPVNHQLSSQTTYSELTNQYHASTHPSQNLTFSAHQTEVPMSYSNLPPPPPGQAPVPMHEVFASARPFPGYQNLVPSGPYHPQPGVANRPPQSQPLPLRPASRLEMAYSNEPPAQNSSQHAIQMNSVAPESVMTIAYENQVQTPHLLPHIQNQPQFQLYQSPQSNHSTAQPPPPSQMFYQTHYGISSVPVPVPTPVPLLPSNNGYRFYQPSPGPSQNSLPPPPPPPGNQPYLPPHHSNFRYGNHSTQQGHYPV
ncbi:expressed protein [Phakopsora pachyrhizi]|uniref:Expressed protein n=1 Tax=Phakopsora pachyrhizi TaxID=170000 RepID=A0AAV0B786_PHAPC|nr:expressed protein [Phakopsora pachyrhizi]